MVRRTKAQGDAGVGFGAVERGYQTLDKFAEYLRAQHQSDRSLSAS